MVKHAWIEHLGFSRTLFPRGMGKYDGNKFKRFSVRTPIEYIEAIEKNKNDIYTNVYSEPQIRESKVDKLYIDIDSPNLEDAFRAKNSVVGHFKRRYHLKPRTYFTAGKGFAIYLDFPEIIINYKVLRKFVIAELRLEETDERAQFLCSCVDTSVLGDKRRVSRIPYTYNMRTNVKKGKYPFLCIPVKDHWSLAKVLSESIRPSSNNGVNIDTCDTLSGTLLTLNEQYEEELAAEPEVPQHKYKFSKKKAEQVLEFLEERAPFIKDGRTRLLGFVIVPTLVQMDYTLKQVKDYCKQFIRCCPNAVFDEYETYIEATYHQDVEQSWNPWSLQTFVCKYPELLGNFDKENGKHV